MFDKTPGIFYSGKRVSDNVPDDTIKVDMHCHSALSDGTLFPEQLAKHLFDYGVKYASLTDHNTIRGLPAFKQALANYGIGFISGVEITTIHKGTIIHLLAYGFDINNPELNSLLNDKTGTSGEGSSSVMLKVFRTASEIIDIVHKAGGIAVMAHPFHTLPDFKQLSILLNDLKKISLDGLEVLYGPNSQETQNRLMEIAAGNNLLISAGTDFHSPDLAPPGIIISMTEWKTFRDAILKRPKSKTATTQAPPVYPVKQPKNIWMSFFPNIFLPALMTISLFVIALFVIILPYFERTLLERKRDTIKQLTQVAWGVLNEAAEEVESGILSLEQAQSLAKNRIQAMRYGPDNRDYFWLQDLSPRIMMHPYRTDLNNEDVSEYEDANGTRIFVAFAALVQEQGEGFISYVWQWMDDLDRVEPKESYIRIFEPWGWLIGTGIYVYDVQTEIAKLQRRLANVSLVIVFLVLLLMLYLVRQGLLLEHSRKDAEKLLLESVERYRALSEAATEGALFIYEGRCRYGNTVMYELLGCGPEEIELFDLNDVFPDVEANKKWLKSFPNIDSSRDSSPITGVLKRRDGTILCCSLTFRNEPNNPKAGSMILVRRSVDVTEHTGSKVALTRLLNIPTNIASDITDEIKNAAGINEVISLNRKTNRLVVSLLESGTSSIAITYMISTIADVTTQKVIDLCIAELGTPPVPFTFIALGSHGRQAQTMFSDQDNALIYTSDEKGTDKETATYFQKLGTRACDLLEQAGYAKCPGNKIAANPRWCQPLHIWKAYFEEWIRNCEPQQVVEFSIFFDFRPVTGEVELASGLRKHINLLLQETPFFLSQVAQNALLFKTPIRLLGTIMTSGGKKHPGRIDVKSPAMAIVSFARLYALQNYVQETNTLVRLEAIKSLGIILDSKHRDILTAYEKLVRMRLWNQARALENNLEPDNWVDPGHLGHLEEVLLRECFKEIDELQSFIQKDFFN